MNPTSVNAGSAQSARPTAGTDPSRAMQQYFYALADDLTRRLQPKEFFTANFAAEDSYFIRLNKGQVRQAGVVAQKMISIDLVEGARHAGGETTLSGDPATDQQRLAELLTSLRGKLPVLPEDPHLLYATEVRSTEQHGANRLPATGEALDLILTSSSGLDFVGIWASGGIYTGFANSLGQRNWFSTYTFNLDWSLYHAGDKAVKSGYAGFGWEPEQFRRKLDDARAQLAILAQPPRSIEPGRYRVYLSPVAMQEILGTLAWGGFGTKDHRTRQSTLLRLVEGPANMSPMVTIAENTKDGVAPNFQSAGFIKPYRVVLIERGHFRESLTSPRSAREYGVENNGATDAEWPESVEMDAGSLDSAKVLAELGTGIHISNLWYLNYSDRPNCRMTGMTRFACFWVEKGVIQAPLNVMRFDETAFRMLSEHLVGLTR